MGKGDASGPLFRARLAARRERVSGLEAFARGALPGSHRGPRVAGRDGPVLSSDAKRPGFGKRGRRFLRSSPETGPAASLRPFRAQTGRNRRRSCLAGRARASPWNRSRPRGTNRPRPAAERGFSKSRWAPARAWDRSPHPRANSPLSGRPATGRFHFADRKLSGAFCTVSGQPHGGAGRSASKMSR